MPIAGTAAIILLLLPLGSPVLVPTPSPVLQYHDGRLLAGENITLRLVWYGRFSRSQRSIIRDFLLSLSSPRSPPPSVASWWATTGYYRLAPRPLAKTGNVFLSPSETLLPSYPLGRSLPPSALASLAVDGGAAPADVAIVLTSSDVDADGFCFRNCGAHSRLPGGQLLVWVGDASARCPALCTWPFHPPFFGPRPSPIPLRPPNADLGADAVVVNLASLLAAAVTNPDGDGFFQGPADAPLEAVSSCAGIFAAGAYPGFPGHLLLDSATGASYNAHGIRRRKFLLPAMWDPRTSRCAALV